MGNEYVKLKGITDFGKEFIQSNGSVWLVVKVVHGSIMLLSLYQRKKKRLWVGDNDSRFEIVGRSNSYKTLMGD